MKNKFVLVLWLIVILFPFEWLSRFSARYAATLGLFFGTLTSHVVIHAALFAGLTLCLMGLLATRPNRQAVIITLVAVACAAVGQELLQCVSRGVLPVADTWLDLVVDMTGGTVVLVVTCYLRARQRRMAWMPQQVTVHSNKC